MRVQLNLLRGPRQQEFIDYLNSALRKRTALISGSAGLDEEGNYLSEFSGAFQIDQGIVNLTWCLTKNATGVLTTLSAEKLDDATTGVEWEHAVYEFVTSVLAATLSEARQKYFHRALFYYIGSQLDGEYWLPGYRFAPAFPADPNPQLVNAERVVAVDQNVVAIDGEHAFAVAEVAARRHAARLSLLLNTGLYKTDQTQRWVWPVVDGNPASESVRWQVGFEHPSVRLSAMPAKGQLCNFGGYAGSLSARYPTAGKLLSLPSEARKILRGVDEALPIVTESFDRCARLYQVATVCGGHFPSVALAYRVAAVEAISAADPESKGFSDFMRRYITSQANIETELRYLYGDARSAHFHHGKFSMGEFERGSYFSNPFIDAEEAERDMFRRTCHELTREAVVNWMSTIMPEAPVSDCPEIEISNP